MEEPDPSAWIERNVGEEDELSGYLGHGGAGQVYLVISLLRELP